MPHRRLLAVLCCALALCVFTQAADVAVVCPEPFRAALAPWVEHRIQQGHRVVLLSNVGTFDDIRRRIRNLAASSGAADMRPALRFVLLVGDAPPQEPRIGHDAVHVPTYYAPARIVRHLGEQSDIATDNAYADLDDDGIPDLAIGRLTADTPDQLRTMVAKILAFESPQHRGAWCRRVNFVAGVGGFGALADAALENAARKFITEHIPSAYEVTMTQASWSSPYFPGGSAFRTATVARLNEGSLLWCYIGHGDRRQLDSFRVPTPEGDVYYPIFSHHDCADLQCAAGQSPIAVMLACSTGAFDDPQHDCLAEELLQHSGGPVAVVCASRVALPYAMLCLSYEMLQECFVHRRATLGEILLRAKRNTVLRQRDGELFRAMDAVASVLNFHDDLPAERLEHLHLFNLLGDPLLRIPHPRPLRLTVPAEVAAGGHLHVQGTCQLAGRCTVELTLPRDAVGPRRAPRVAPLPDAQHAGLFDEYRQANDRRLAWVQVPLAQGAFLATLRVPELDPTDCQVRVLVEGDGEVALGAVPVRVVPMRP
jgi:hypothetical protein